MCAKDLGITAFPNLCIIIIGWHQSCQQVPNFEACKICTYSALRCPDDLDRGSAELKRTVGGIEKTTVQTQMQTHILGPRIAKGQHVVWVILVSCALCFWCSLWWKHAGPKCLGFVWQKTSAAAAAALVSYSWLAFFGWSPLVAISHTSYASFNEILQPTCWYHMTTSMINLQPEEVVYLSSNWKGSPMNIPLRPFCLKLAGGVAERHTKDHTRFPHPQAALEHLNDIAWYRNAFHCHKDLGVGNPRKIIFCALKQSWSYPHVDAMSQSRLSVLVAGIYAKPGQLDWFNRGMHKPPLGFKHHDLDVLSLISYKLKQGITYEILSFEWLCTSQYDRLPGTAMKCIWNVRPTPDPPWKEFAMYNVQRFLTVMKCL